MILEILLSAVLSIGSAIPLYRTAAELYDKGLYESARTAFESLPDNALTDGYELLCALKLGSDDTDAMFESFDHKYQKAALKSEVCFEMGRALFDKERYPEALDVLLKVAGKDISKDNLAELYYKMGFCEFSAARYPEAAGYFIKVDDQPVCEWTAPAAYDLGFMEYADGNIDEASKWFEKAAQDSRFRDIAQYYLIECDFLNGEYSKVTEKAEEVFDNLPQPRQERLARLLSESYLVLGNKEAAYGYYDRASHEDMTRSDYFYGGSVLYAVEDYLGAIENFSKMEDRTDSLGQIANYQMGNAYLKTRNKVGALEAFRAAADLSFDPVMQEDAYLNFAKLCYDINQDNSGFEGYIEKYSTSRRGEQIYGYMALTALNRHDYAAAVESYDNIEELDSDMRGNYMKANFLRGMQLYESGAYSDAIPCLRAAAFYLPKQNRFNQLARFWLAECYYKTEKFEDAEGLYSALYNLSALQSNIEGAVLPYNLAYAFFNQSKFESASRWFDLYTSGGPVLYKEDALMRRADCDFLNRDYKSAVSAYQKLIDLDCGGLYPYYRQGMSYGLLGNKKSKVAILSKAILADPSTPMYKEVLYELGRAYMDVKDTKSALTSFDKLKELSESDPVYRAKALIGLGMVNRNAGDQDKALECYKEVVSSMYGTEYANDALLAIESIYQARKQPEKYLEYVESNKLNAGKSDSDKEQLYFNTAEQIFLAENYQQALVSLQKYIETYPQGSKLPDAYFYMAESYKALGAKEKACECYRNVATLAPQSSFAEASLLNYSAISYELERFKDSYRGYGFLLNAAKLDDNMNSAKLGMMRSAFRAREYTDAIEAALKVEAIQGASDALVREAMYVRAKSNMSLSQRDEALDILRVLAKNPENQEGAEAACIIIQDMYDRGDFDAVEKAVYSFTEGAGQQSYWLAKAFIVLGNSFVERRMYDQAEATFVSVRDGYEAPEGGDDILDTVNASIARLNSLKK